MFDEKYDVHPEIAKSMPQAEPEEVQEQPVVEQQVAPKVEVPEEPVKKEDPNIAKSWREIRSAMKKAEQERDEALRLLREQQQKQQPIHQEEEISFNDTDLMEGKHLKAYNRKQEEKIRKLEEQQKQQYQVYQAELSKAKLKQRYPDFESVVNQDTIDMLQVLQPEMAQTLNASTDIYATGVTAYTLIKNLGIQSSEPYRQDIEAAKKNISKPRPLTSIAPQQGDTPLSRANMFANGLTEELRNQLWKETKEFAKKV